MGRTLNSKSLRFALWSEADGKCKICGVELPDDWHADHIVPWSVTHETNLHDMQALCPQCNLKKGSKMAMRKFQNEFNNAVKKISNNSCKVIVAHVTPGGGKSRLPVIAAKNLIGKMADKLLWVVPRDNLRTQAVESFEKTRVEFQHDFSIRASGNDVNPSRGTTGYVTTYQAIANNPDLHAQELSRSGYILVLDEVQHVRDGGRWHDSTLELVDKCKLLILMSGGLERGDNLPIAYFNYNGTEIDLVDKPDRKVISYSRKTALIEKAIVPIEFIHVDGQARWTDEYGIDNTVASLAECDENNGRKALWTALHTDYAEELLTKTMDHYKIHREQNPWAQLLIVAPRIEQANRYAEYVRSKMGMECRIAHSDDSDSQKNIEDFRGGKFNALSTVGMAYEGMDVPRITHVAVLTYYRSKAWIEQMLARIARTWLNKIRGYAFCPDDVLFAEVIKQIRAEQLTAIEEGFEPPCLPFLPKNSSGESGKEPPNGIIPLDSEATHSRISLLDDTNDTITSGQVAWMQANGMSQSSFHDVKKALTLIGQVVPELKVSIDPMSSSNDETVKRKQIEERVRSIDFARGQTPGTTNGQLKKKFKKPRKDMTAEELNATWAHLCEKYPVATGAN